MSKSTFRLRCFFRKPGAVLFAVFLAFGVSVWATTAVITVFELDGNSVVNAPGADDWDLLNGTGTGGANPGGSPGGSTLRVFAQDGIGQTIFTGGGSKDNLDVTSWLNKSGSVPDKDEIEQAFAASYTAENGDVIIAFGATRLAVNGDANIGVWFFQNEVGPDGSGGFTGSHVNGDVFIVSAFTNGGTVPGIKVYEWDNACLAADNNSPQVGQCADKNIRVLFNAAQTCAPAGRPGHEACAQVNSSPIFVSWPYAPKGGEIGDPVPPGGFFEGAINITELFEGIGATRPCFASFLVETRSSASIDAVLKDFVAHSFPQCRISLAKACACTAFHPDGSGFDYAFDFTVTNSGGGTVFNVTVSDQGKTYNCGTLNPSESKTTSQCTGPAPTFTATTFPATNQATATASTSLTGGSTLTATTDPVSCSTESPAGACTPNAVLRLDKVCVTALQVIGSNVVARVDFTGKVHNEGNVDINDVVVTEDDNSDGSLDQTFTVGSLPKGASKCYTNGGLVNCPSLLPIPAFNQPPVAGAGSYFPSTGTGVDPGRVQFSDTVRATGTDAVRRQSVASHPAGSGVTANCLICPFGACPVSSQ